jgi:hypothetical protein
VGINRQIYNKVEIVAGEHLVVSPEFNELSLQVLQIF